MPTIAASIAKLQPYLDADQATVIKALAAYRREKRRPKPGGGERPGPDRKAWRVLPPCVRNAMMAALYDKGWSMQDIADFTREDAHRTTVARAIDNPV